MPKPTHKPTPDTRRQVETMAGLGIRQVDMLKVLGIGSKVTLEKHYRAELDVGMAKARAKVMQTLYSMATSGRDFKATKYWLEVQGGEEWNLAKKLEHSGPNGGSISIQFVDDILRTAKGE